MQADRIGSTDTIGRQAAISALLDWWKTSGADVQVADAPTPWFAPAQMASAAVAQTPRVPVIAPAADPFASLSSLDALTSHVRAAAPALPFADGDPASRLMILGEGPSAEDLRSGRPFTGPAGQLLDRMLAAIGVDRRSAYIALLCPHRRVPGPPSPDEIAAEMPLTRAHIRLAAPRHILLLGANPLAALTASTLAISRARGQWFDVEAGAGVVPALATFNPAYLLRRPEEKAKAWADLLALKRRIAQ